MSILNNSLLLGQEGGGGYAISRSLRFNSSDSAYLSRTPASAGNRKTWTWAGWVKRGSLSGTQWLFECSANATYYTIFALNSDALYFYDQSNGAVTTTAVYRDASAWMHVCLAVDTTQATASNRVKIYVNGSQVTALTGTAYPALNADTGVNSATLHSIGARYDGSYSLGFNGLLADIHFCDGTAYDASAFGEFDANGIWQPKKFAGVYGSQGWHLDFADNSTAAALGTDTSGNGNTWTVNNITPYNSKSILGVNYDGNADYLQLAYSSDLDFGSGDFTIEGYISTRSTGVSRIIANFIAPTATTGADLGWILGISSSNILEGVLFNGTSAVGLIQAGTVAANTWYHVAYVRSGTNFYLFLNGTQVGTATGSGAHNSNASWNISIGYGHSAGTQYFNGVISNLRITKGTALYTSGFTPPTTPLSTVTNTKLLCCQSSVSATTATVAPGTITGNGDVYVTTFRDSSPNDDSLVDVPTNGSEVDTGLGGQVRGNYCTWNPLKLNTNGSLANGNLDWSCSSTGGGLTVGTIGVSSGKWYWEVTINSGTNCGVGVFDPSAALTTYSSDSAKGIGYYGSSGGIFYSGGSTSYGNTFTTGDTIGVALDLDNGKIYFSKNGTWQNSGNPATQTNPARTGLSGTYAPEIDGGASNAHSASLNAGARSFAYTAPSGFRALCTANLPAPVVTKPSTVMDVKLYTGTGSNQTITGLGFSPDLVWGKNRTDAASHQLYDTVRGAGKVIYSNSAAAEEQPTDTLSAFTSTGFTLDAAAALNASTKSFAAWCWDAGSSTVTNTQGSISSQVRANASAGFSVVSYTGTRTSAGNDTIGHGLNAQPALVISKDRDNATPWIVQHISLGSDQYLQLNTTGSASNSVSVGAGSLPKPTSSVFYGSWLSGLNTNGAKFVAYCFAPVAGYSAMGSYVGNGSSDGSFIYTGHRSRWIMIKATSIANESWIIIDTARSTYNVVDAFLRADTSGAEFSSSLRYVDILSNGFKLRASGTEVNGSGTTYVYASFAESPFQYARAR